MFNAPKSKSEEVAENRARFVVEPLEPGFGYTLGNTMRRTLLSRIPGAAITAIQIEGVEHEFSTVPGVVEDVVDMILNIKRVVIRMEGNDEHTLYLSAKGAGNVTAKDLKLPAGVEVVNPDAHIATLSASGRLEMEMTVAPGVGYRTADGNKGGSSTIGVIPVDSIFSPVRKVSYKVENTQVGQMTNYDRLVLDVETNGAIEPKDAVSSAGKTLGELMDIFSDVGQGEGLELVDVVPRPVVRPTSNCPSRHSIFPSVPATACVGLRSRP